MQAICGKREGRSARKKAASILHQSVRHIKFPLFGQAYVYASIEVRRSMTTCYNRLHTNSNMWAAAGRVGAGGGRGGGGGGDTQGVEGCRLVQAFELRLGLFAFLSRPYRVRFATVARAYAHP